MDKQLINRILPHYLKKRILVTGASGYLATNLINAIKDIDCTIIRLSRSSSLPPIDGKAHIIDVSGDICTIQTWENIVNNIDIVFHFAAQTSVYVADENPIDDFKINVLPMLSLLQTCRNKKVRPIIIFSGTVTEAGIPRNLPVNETCEDHPITIYDLHKLMAENYLKYYCSQGIVQGTILRLANVYGPGPKSSSSDRGIINLMMCKALANECLIIYGKGDCLRDYIFIEDVTSAFLETVGHIGKLNGKYFVLGSGQGHTLAKAVNLIVEQVFLKNKKRVEVKHVEPPLTQSPIETRNFVADSRQFSNATGWKAKFSLIEGIDRTIDSC